MYIESFDRAHFVKLLTQFKKKKNYVYSSCTERNFIRNRIIQELKKKKQITQNCLRVVN